MKLLHLFLLCLVLASIVSLPSGTQAQEIAILTSSHISPYDKAIQGFTSAIRSTIQIKEYAFHGDVSQGREVAKTIRASNPRLLFAVGLKAALVAKVEILDIPIVFCLVMHPEQNGLPTSNMTGIRLEISSQQQLMTMQEVLPELRRVGLLYNPDTAEVFVHRAKQEAQDLGITLITLPISQEDDVPDALRSLLPQIEALWLIRDASIVNPESLNFLIGTSLDHTVPVFGFSAGLVQHGALAALSTTYQDVGWQSAQMAKELLSKNGALHLSPQLRYPERSRLALNLNTAEYLGLKPTQQSLKVADALFGGPGDMAHLDILSTKDLP
jgi:putative ABC transport system substrate-binding protein